MGAARPLILALETATRAVSVALLRGDEPWLEECAAPERPAAETLLAAIDALLRRADCALERVEALALSIGPGSFTSLRVGLATAKGLVFGRACPLLPVATLEALALAGRAFDASCEVVVPLLDARRGEVYAAAYAWQAERPRVLLEEGVYRPQELAGRLPESCLLVGEGVAVAGEVLCARLGAGARRAPAEVAPRACFVGALGARALAAGRAADPDTLVPRYLRRAQAEVVRTGERFEDPR